MGANYAGDVIFPLVDPVDVANAAIEELLSLTFTGKSDRYIVSEETTPNEFVKVIGEAVGKPDLNWAFVADEQLKIAVLKGGLTETLTNALVEMGQIISSGEYVSEYLAKS